MNKDKSTIETEVRIIKDQLWRITKMFRGRLEGKNNAVILYLLMLHVKGKIKVSAIHRDDYNIEPFHQEEFGFDASLKIYSYYNSILENLKFHERHELFHFFQSLELDLIETYLPEIFDDFLYRLGEKEGKKGGISILPKELSSFLANFFDLPPKATVYNPFAGLASFEVFMNGEHSFIGQELNNDTYHLALLRLYAHNRLEKSYLSDSDSIEDWYADRKKYDLIISAPPIGLKISPRNYMSRYGTVESFLLNNGITGLEENGKMISLLAPRVLFASDSASRSLRFKLVDEDLIHTIIQFPSGILSDTGIPVIALIIDKVKKEKNKVRFIDASSCYTQADRRKKYLNLELLNQIISSDDESSYQRIVSKDEIINFQYNLDLGRYFIPKEEADPNYSYVELQEVITPAGRGRSKLSDKGKLVKTGNLSDDFIKCQLNINDISESQIPYPSNFIAQDCLLFSNRFANLKPTLFESKGQRIFFKSDIIPFQIDQQKIVPEYLIHQLSSDYVKKQVEALSTGSVMPRISLRDLPGIKIKLPIQHGLGKLQESLDVQRASVKAYKEAYLKKKQDEFLAEKELLGLKEESFRELASIRHSMRQYLSALQANLLGTRKFLAKHKDQPISLDTIYSKTLDRSLEQQLLSSEEIVDSMSTLLEQFGETKVSEKKQIFNLEELIRNAQNRFANPLRFTFDDLFLDESSFEEEEKLELRIEIDEEDFYRIFSNVIANALKHGFKDKEKQYRIATSLAYDSETQMCILEIANNGEPVNEKFSFQDLITRGEKTTDSDGAGTGGADIRALVNHYEGSFDWKTVTTDEFPVVYIIQFPIYKNHNNEL